MSVPIPPRGRGAASNPHNRFAPTRSQAEDDGLDWFDDSDAYLDEDAYDTDQPAKSSIDQFNDGCVVLGMIFAPSVIGAFYIARWLFGQ